MEAYPPETAQQLIDETGISAPASPPPMHSMPDVKHDIDDHDGEANHGQYNQSTNQPESAAT